MKDLLNKLLPARSKQGGTLPKYSAKKRNKLITFGILAAVIVTAGVYLFITLNPLKSSVTTLSETPDIAFSQFHKHIKAGNRKEIIARMSRNFKGGVTQKREVIKILEGLKGTDYTIKKNLSTSKGEIHTFTYSLVLHDKSVTLSDETWQKNPDENKWYLLQEGKDFQQISSLISNNVVDNKANAPAAQAFYEVEKTIPEGASFLSALKNLDDSYKKVKNTAFYTELTKIITKKGVTNTELALVETAITSLFGQNVVFANYGNSNNYLTVSKLSGSIKLLSPIIENILKLVDKKIKITSTTFDNTKITTILSGKNKAFYAFSENFLHISDSELLLKKSLELAGKKKEGSILNNPGIFTFLTDLRSDYKYYLLDSYSESSSPDFFNYGYLEDNTLQSRTSIRKDTKGELSQQFISDDKNTFNGTESLFDILPNDKYGFLALAFDFTARANAGIDPDFAKASKTFEENTGLNVQETFSNKILFTILSGSGTSIGNFFFPVVIAETKANMAEKALMGIAKKHNFAIKNEEGTKYFSLNLAPNVDVIVSAMSNNLVITLGMPGFKKVLLTSTSKHPNIRSNAQWNGFFVDKTSAKLLYSFNIDSFLTTITEIYARSNINLLQSQQITKRESLDVLNLLGVFKNLSGKLQIADGTLIEKGKLLLRDIDPPLLRAQTKGYMKKSSLDLQSLLTSQMFQGVNIVAPGTSTRISSGIVPERKIEGFIYNSKRIRDPFSPSYMILKADYAKEVQGKQNAESLYQEMVQEFLRLEQQYLIPITFDKLFLGMVKENDPALYQNIVKYAKLFKSDNLISLDTFEELKKSIFAYNDLFTTLKSKYEEDYLDKNKLPHHILKSLKLKGIATGALGAKALILAGGRGHFIAEGDYISSGFYFVQKISNGNVQLVKKSFNYKFSPTTQELILSINN